MKTSQLLLSIVLLAATIQNSNAAGFTRLQNDQHVVADECTIYVNMKAEFPFGSEMSAFGGAGSDAALEKIQLISGLLASRGYRITTDEARAEFKLELSNGVQCVMTDGQPGKFAQWMLDNFDTDITASGRFSGKTQDGLAFENTAKHTFVDFHKTSEFRGLVKQIVSYCRKAK